MNGKTARLINKLAFERGENKRKLVREWWGLPPRRRAEIGRAHV